MTTTHLQIASPVGQLALGIQPPNGQERLLFNAVADKVQLAGFGVFLGVSGESRVPAGDLRGAI